MTALLKVEGLTIGFGKAAPVVEDVSFAVEPGETLALVGESGSGKTLSCRAALLVTVLVVDTLSWMMASINPS